MSLPNAADFISCDREGVRMTESDSMAFSESEPEPVPVEQSADRAERILARMEINDRQEAYALLDQKSKRGGVLVTLVIVGWWLFIGLQGDDVGGESVFFGLGFSSVAITVMVLSAVSALLSELSKDRGDIYASALSGGMMIFAVLYVAEPLVGSLLVDGFLSVGEGFSRSLRLAGLWGGMTYGANLLVNALLVNWLLTFMDAHGLDYIGDHTEVEGAAEAVVE